MPFLQIILHVDGVEGYAPRPVSVVETLHKGEPEEAVYYQVLVDPMGLPLVEVEEQPHIGVNKELMLRFCP